MEEKIVITDTLYLVNFINWLTSRNYEYSLSVI